MIARYAPNFGWSDLWSAVRLSSEAGPALKEVEARLAHELGQDHVQLCPSARGAMRLILRALPAPYDRGRVVIPAYTCSAVAEAAQLAGREIVTVEHRAGGLNLAPEDLAGILRPGDVVIATHQYGYPCDIVGLLEVARGAGALVIEDIAAALGATIGGQPAGSFGFAAFGSFDASKLLHVPPKGGFAVTTDAEFATRLRAQATRDLTPFTRAEKARALLGAALLLLLTQPWIYPLFYQLNFKLRGRLTAEDGRLAVRPNGFYTKAFAEWQAAILLPQLRDMAQLMARRAAIIESYRHSVSATARFDVELARVEQPGAVIRFPLYVRGDKAAMHDALLARGVDTGFSFTSIVAPPEACNAWAIARSVLNLPTSTRLTEQQVQRVIAAAQVVGART